MIYLFLFVTLCTKINLKITKKFYSDQSERIFPDVRRIGEIRQIGEIRLIGEGFGQKNFHLSAGPCCTL